MNNLARIQRHFIASPSPFKKPRPTVADFCLTQDFEQAQWVMIGVPDDRGVKNNYGRIGAAQGPDAFRNAFYALPIGATVPAQRSIFDLGNLKLTGTIACTHALLIDIIAQIQSSAPSKKILVIGGGHDIAYGEIAGCVIDDNPAHHHIINLDAHSDVRPLEQNNIISSGTPFYRLILEQEIPGANYHPFGLQKPSNSSQLVTWMTKHNVDTHWLEDMPTEQNQSQAWQTLLTSMHGKKWHFNIDLDAFAVAHAPGVSAQATFGLSPQLCLNLTKHKQSFQTLETLGIYELAPPYDIDNRTAKLAAKLAYQALSV